MADLSKRTLKFWGWFFTLIAPGFAFLAGYQSLWPFLVPAVTVSALGLVLRLKADEAPE